jgi:hypothetical protein
MAVKKRGKKKVSRKTSRRTSRSVSSKTSVKIYNSASVLDRKKKIVLTNLGLFVILFVASLGLYYVSPLDSLWYNFFWITSIITGFASVAFVIVYLILFFMKVMKR